MKRTRIKICGITSAADGWKAVEAGADAIGLVFYPDSPRALGAEDGARIASALPPFVTVAGLFVDPDRDEVAAVLERCPLDILQFHGEETPELCRAFGRRYLKAVRVTRETDVRPYAEAHGPQRLLLDTHVPGQAGGTGQTFQWSVLPEELAGKAVLAGGLTPANVTEAVRTVRPFAVDVSSGVEEHPGVKSAERIAAFVQGVRDGDSR